MRRKKKIKELNVPTGPRIAIMLSPINDYNFGEDVEHVRQQLHNTGHRIIANIALMDDLTSKSFCRAEIIPSHVWDNR